MSDYRESQTDFLDVRAVRIYNSVNYVVRDNQADLDNLTCEISLSKV